MRILVISDIHANLTALEAVLLDAGTPDATWCLGDVVGYGPDPNECIALLLQQPNFTCIKGNHDAAALGEIPIETFNYDARRSIEWIQETLTPRSLAFLTSLQESVVVRDANATLAHGSPRNPVWEYILDLHNASQNFKYFDTRVCMVGHTHLPVTYQLQNVDDNYYDLRLLLPNESQLVRLATRAIVNPGSVGQPRDHDPRASYAIFDSTNFTWQLRRVTYDISSVQKRIQGFSLPARHAARLLEGW